MDIDFAWIILCKTYAQKWGAEMTVYGYARVSTDGQTLAAQDAALHAAGAAKVYAEKVSGASTDGRKALAQALKALRPGDPGGDTTGSVGEIYAGLSTATDRLLSNSFLAIAI
jgi:hypothetical protein